MNFLKELFNFKYEYTVWSVPVLTSGAYGTDSVLCFFIAYFVKIYELWSWPIITVFVLYMYHLWLLFKVDCLLNHFK